MANPVQPPAAKKPWFGGVWKNDLNNAQVKSAVNQLAMSSTVKDANGNETSNPFFNLDIVDRQTGGVDQEKIKQIQQKLTPDEYRAAMAKKTALETRDNAARQAMTQANIKHGGLGDITGSIARNLGFASEGGLLSPGAKNLDGTGAADFWRSVGGSVGNMAFTSAGDSLGRALYNVGTGAQAEAASRDVGAQIEYQNDQARGQIMDAAEQQAQDMNLQNAAAGMQMTGNTIAQDNAFESGMQGIGMSGIEGSDNMERNLKYGQSMADAQAQIEMDAMGNRSQAMGNNMASSFDQLSQRKGLAMDQAFNDVWRQDAAQDHADTRAAGEYAMATQTNDNDWQDLANDLTSGTDTAPVVSPAAESQQAARPGWEDVFNFYSGPGAGKSRSNAESEAFLNSLNLTPEQRAEFDQKMAYFAQNKDREGRRVWTQQFFERLGGR